MSLTESLSVAANIATSITALAILIAVASLLGEKQQRHREFENMYVQRYWNLLDRMSDALLKNSNRLTKADKRVAMDYLRLCEDEVDLRSVGLITHKTWSIWGPAILAVARSDSYARLLASTPPAELQSLRIFLQEGRDPYTRGASPVGRAWSKLNGL